MRIFLTLLLTLLSGLSFGSVYKTLDLNPAPEAFSHSMISFFEKQGFSALKSGEGFPSIGINQIFLNSNASEFITVKYDVSGDFPLNELQELDDGSVFHTEISGKTIAFYFKGLSNFEVKQLSVKLRAHDWKTLTTKFFHELNPLKKAKAEDCDIELVQDAMSSSAIGTMAKVTYSAAASALMNCLSGAKDGAQASLNFGPILKSAKSVVTDLWNNPAKEVSRYYSAVSGAVVGLVGIVKLIGQAMINPQAGIPQLVKKLGPAGEILGDIIKTAITFPGTAVNIMCSMISSIGVDSLLNALVGGAGTVLLAIKLKKMTSGVSVLGQLSSTMKKLKLTSLEQLGMAPDSLSKIFKKLIDGTLDQRKFNIFSKSLEADSPIARTFAVRGLQCSL